MVTQRHLPGGNLEVDQVREFVIPVATEGTLGEPKGGHSWSPDLGTHADNSTVPVLLILPERSKTR